MALEDALETGLVSVREKQVNINLQDDKFLSFCGKSYAMHFKKLLKEICS